MKKSKLLGAFLVGAMALLGSNLARAAVTPITDFPFADTTTVGYLIKFLLPNASATYMVKTPEGATPIVNKSADVDVRPYTPIVVRHYTPIVDDVTRSTVSVGTAQLTDGSYGWASVRPVAGTTMAFRIYSATGGVEVTALPEPGTYALIGLGVAGLVLARRRQKKAVTALGQFAV